MASGDSSPQYIRWFEELTTADVSVAGGKNASLGEMTGALANKGIRLPQGFAVTAEGYWHFIDESGLRATIERALSELAGDPSRLDATSDALRELIEKAPLPAKLQEAIRLSYRALGTRIGTTDISVAVRSSATAEDLPGASFAGQQESYLDVSGEDAVIEAVRRCFASLFTARAISYREAHGFAHMAVGMSVGIQQLVAWPATCAGVMFTLDLESGFPRAIVIDAAWGIGEAVVKGEVSPDEYTVFKPSLDRARQPILRKLRGAKLRKLVGGKAGKPPRFVETTDEERLAFCLSDEDVTQLARWAVLIEDHYGRPMDIEWAKDATTGDLFVLQARPETVHSGRGTAVLKHFRLKGKPTPVVSGVAIGDAIASGRVTFVQDAHKVLGFREGDVLVTASTSPDWVPLMKKASAIVTDLGGRTSHAAIVSRELGVPAVVGTGSATSTLRDGDAVTVSCCEGSVGYVYEGAVAYEEILTRLDDLPVTRTEIMLNVAIPEAAFRWWSLPADGIGLARMEFIITNLIRVHPMALLRFDEVSDTAARAEIEALTAGYASKAEYFVDQLAQGIALIAASRHPKPVIVRFSDFKTNEYAQLLGGRQFEPHEENPMLGWRGASRYYDDRYRDGFALECAAVRRVRQEMGLDNVVVMIPFCRTTEEADRVLAVMAEEGLERGSDGLKVYLMCEIPSNVVLAAEFARRFDGFSIGSNDLTQLVLGVDRDSADLRRLFDERDPAVRDMIRTAIRLAHEGGVRIGICGQAPSDDPGFADFLVECGIDSISVNPDSFAEVKRTVAATEARLSRSPAGG
jgi:pyruvate,water dikinase